MAEQSKQPRLFGLLCLFAIPHPAQQLSMSAVSGLKHFNLEQTSPTSSSAFHL